MNEETKTVTKVWDSKAEEISYKILCNNINKEKYQISKHIALKEIFKSKKKESWMDLHIDFLIEDAKGYPVLAIEINGIEHWNHLDTKKNDKEKKILFAQAEIPLVSIPLPEIPLFTKEDYKKEYQNALENLMYIYLLPFYQHRTSYPAYCYKCGQKLEYRFKKNYTGAFYCCINKECDTGTISAKNIPLIFNAEKNE